MSTSQEWGHDSNGDEASLPISPSPKTGPAREPAKTQKHQHLSIFYPLNSDSPTISTLIHPPSQLGFTHSLKL